MGTTIKVLSLNMWGVPFASKKIKQRSEHLIEHLMVSDYQIVGLQEVFTSWHAKLIQDGVKSIFGHSHWFRSGSLGSPGLLVLSRYPIVEIAFHPFALNGYPQRVAHGDWWAGKGVGLCRIDHPLATVDFYITHIHANYTHTGYDMYTGHRVSQMYCMAKYIARSCDSDAIIAVGDYNCKEDEVATEVFVEASGLTDSYRELHPDKINDPGYTNDTPECSWRADTSLATLCSNGTCKRIDYIFFNSTKLSCTDSSVVMGKIPGQTFSYSDHLGVSSTFVLKPPSTAVRVCKLSKSTAEGALECIHRSLAATHVDSTQKVVLWLCLTVVWCVVVVAAVLELLPAVVLVLVGSILAAAATAVFWYLVIFCRSESSKFSEAFDEMQILTRFAE
ncbi:putative neutral sphingomyelinase [Bolinopsis microptera]|uniref:putative neutral sphingomyelinase n=1 Tax=Bolinopsis microptera TaxID=2820187 RepID=UPI003078DCC2